MDRIVWRWFRLAKRARRMPPSHSVAGLGGLAPLQFNYEGMGILLGVLGVIAALIFKLLTTDPMGRR